ncbi:Fur family transcriptional regulator [uncultured Clostridium sp.]|uniref:Fur family transcriptional regulator n=1 Tax=uncultured Clostridium sp. TaxID=59620 RepID=UPI0028E2B54A|nr:Fur family transcriptional regulator [uncultured Clostridium sp.]
MDVSNKEIKEFLLKNNIKATDNRIKIMKYLMTLDEHPTAEEIYNGLIDKLPTLSRTTVYNTLNIFKAAKLIKTVSVGEREVRYDINKIDHGHFKCENCGKIINFPIEFDEISIDMLKGCKINDKYICFKGICSKCVNKKVLE